MAVIVDEESVDAEELGLSTIGHVLSYLQASERLVVRLLLDGEEPNLNQINGIKSTPLEGRTLYIETADPRETALDSLSQADQRLAEADKFKSDAADRFRNNQWGAGMEKLGECLTRWQDAQRTVMAVARYFSVDLERLDITGRPLAKLFTDFAGQLRDIHAAMKSGDGVALTDLLEYETADTSSGWQNALRGRNGDLASPIGTISGMNSAPSPQTPQSCPSKFLIEEQCELGQHQLMAMEYLAAAATLGAAARGAQAEGDFALMSRILLPLQEAHRLRRQKAGDGIVCLDLVADDSLTPTEIVRQIPCGQLLVLGQGSIHPALQVRHLQEIGGLYLDAFLGALYPTDAGALFVVVPLPGASLPSPLIQKRDDLAAQLPAGSQLFRPDDLPRGRHTSTADTFSQVMSIWELLHSPFLNAADNETDPLRKIAAYQITLEVDYACELAHQRLAETVHRLARD